jgi:hypothetical protein
VNEHEEQGMESLLQEILRSEPEIVAWLEQDEDGGDRDEPAS